MDATPLGAEGESSNPLAEIVFGDPLDGSRQSRIIHAQAINNPFDVAGELRVEGTSSGHFKSRD
jgi:hypothetical protein